MKLEIKKMSSTILPMGYFLLSIMMVVKNIKLIRQVSWNQFEIPELWAIFFMSVLGYGLLWAGAFFYRRHFNQNSFFVLSICFLTIPYCVAAINGIWIQTDLTVVLWVMLGFLFLGGILLGGANFSDAVNSSSKRSILCWGFYFVILLWLVNALIRTLQYNFTFQRSLYVDEINFWVSAAHNIISKGFMAAHMEGYSAGNWNPFGVSFLAAFPTVLFRSASLHGVFLCRFL